jgi:hypothetical protein
VTDDEATALEKPSGDATEVLRPQAQPRAETHQPLDFSQNRHIDRFELIRELARGGMGQVFLARDTKLGRKVAIKFLLRDDPDFVQRFLVEARATARCTHENIVTIYEVGEYRGLPYMVLELLEGETLSKILDEKPGVKQVVELMIPIVRALERAHEHGIVHRDLKPSNVIVTHRGHVKVLDFGVARLIDRAGELTNAVDPRASIAISESPSVTFTGSNSVVGTLPYMSPEQWGSGVVDHLSDLWAVGIIFWRALTDKHPAGTTSPDKLRKRLSDLSTPLPSLATASPDAPPKLVAIVDRVLEMQKGRRYQHASELLADLQALTAPVADARTEEECPYRGLASFGETDAKYFFGRASEIRTSLAQLQRWPLLAVIGPSGVGKSSFVHAGLLPALRATGRWQACVLRPGRVPLHRLANVLEDTFATGDHHSDMMSRLIEAPGLFGTMLRETATRRAQKVVVVVDQLEELFTLCDSEKIRETFLAALLAAADDPSSPVRVVLSMRADFLDRLAGHERFLTELSRGLFFLTAPDRENLREAILRPAGLAGYMFEESSIIDEMVEAATSRGALPLLSFAAERLWDGRDRMRKLFPTSAYRAMGGIGGAFARHADQVAASVPPQSQLLLRAIMTRLVTPEGTRAIVDRKELVSLAKDPRDVETILDLLVQGRLVHLHTDLDQVATVEIVHEMLITEWPTLQRWLEDSQALRGFMHELRQAARQWDTHGRSADRLWRGASAEEAIGLARRHVLDLSSVEAAFLEAVREHATRMRRRKMLFVTSTIAVLALVIAAGAFFTVQLSAANKVARQNEAAAESAKTSLQQKLELVEQKEAARIAAETQAKAAQEQATKADENVKLSREELEKANVDLRRALGFAEVERKRAETAAQAARKASDDAAVARAAAEAMAERERARAEKAEAESRNIYNKDLRRGSGSAR